MMAQSRIVVSSSYCCQLLICEAREGDIPAIKKIFRANKRYLGFTTWPILSSSIAKSELHVAVFCEHIVGFIRWHRRRDGWSTVYELCVDEPYRGRGVGRMLMQVIGTGPAKLKCHTANPALKFYDLLGFRTGGRVVTKGGIKLSFLMRNNGRLSVPER